MYSLPDSSMSTSKKKQNLNIGSLLGAKTPRKMESKESFEFMLNVVDVEGVQAVNDGEHTLLQPRRLSFTPHVITFFSLPFSSFIGLISFLDVEFPGETSYLFLAVKNSTGIFSWKKALTWLGGTTIYKILLPNPQEWKDHIQGAVSIIQESKQTL